FWFDAGGYLYDVVDGHNGDDATLRPNQLLAVSLPDAVLDPARWQDVVRTVADQLVVPLAVRTQAPGTAWYSGRAGGSPYERDNAYHRGTAWPWLLGPFVDASRRVDPTADAVSGWLVRLADHLHEAGVGSVSE